MNWAQKKVKEIRRLMGLIIARPNDWQNVGRIKKLGDLLAEIEQELGSLTPCGYCSNKLHKVAEKKRPESWQHCLYCGAL